jgi:hypothetical protein
MTGSRKCRLILKEKILVVLVQLVPGEFDHGIGRCRGLNQETVVVVVRGVFRPATEEQLSIELGGMKPGPKPSTTMHAAPWIRGVRSPTRQHSPQLPYMREIDRSSRTSLCSCRFR